MPNQDVDILSFEDPRAYLVAVLKKTGMGVRELARRANLRSASTLTMVCRGQRRLSTAVAEKIADPLGLHGRRKSYLLALVRADVATSTEQSIAARESALYLKSYREQTPLTLSQYRFLASWYYPAVYELAATKEFRMDAAWIAGRLGKGVTVTSVKQALGDMINLGLLSFQDGKVTRMSPALSTSEDVRSTAIQRYHQEMIGRAGEALTLPLDERDFSGLTIAISKRRIQEVKQKIRKFREELNGLLSAEDSPDEVYQLNVQFFPLTRGNI